MISSCGYATDHEPIRTMSLYEPFAYPLSRQNAALAMLSAVHSADSTKPMHQYVTWLCADHDPIRAVRTSTVPPERASCNPIGSFHIGPQQSHV